MGPSRRRRGRGWSVAVGVAVLAAVVVGCSDDDGVTLADWEPRWEAAVAQAQVPTDPDRLTRDECDRIIVVAREASPELLPTPSPALDGAVEEWLAVVESIGLECDGLPDLGDRLAELDVIEAEVAAGLDALGAG